MGLDVADYNDGTLTVRGKGNKIRLAYVVGGAQAMLEAWLAVPGRCGEAVFVSIAKGRKVTGNRLDGRSLAEILRRRAEEAGIAPFSPHDVRPDNGYALARPRHRHRHSTADARALVRLNNVAL